MCELNGISPLVEKSRSGKGAHVWIFFKKAIPAATARNFGFLLLDKGSTSIRERMGYVDEKLASIQYKMEIYDEFNEEYNYRKQHYGMEQERILSRNNDRGVR